MNQKLQKILNTIQKTKNLSTAEKDSILKALKDTDKELEITAFKLERTEKVKKTTAILLEETIEELEQKRKSVEAQKRELEIEGSLERVRAISLGMQKSEDLINISEILFDELRLLGFSDLRSTQINIHDDDQRSFLNYDYSDVNGSNVTQFFYDSHPVIQNFIVQIKSAQDAFAEIILEGDQLEDWKSLRIKSGDQPDPQLENISSLYYYFYSIGVGAIGISTF